MVSAYCYARCWIIFLYLFLILQLPHQTYSQTCGSSCGKISNINHPFRLKNDPEYCGDKRYELDCVNNITILNLYNGYYLVQSINYNNYTIRLIDPNIQSTDCSSLPCFFLYQNNFTYYYSNGSIHQYLYKNNNSYDYRIYRWNSTSPSPFDYNFEEIDLSRPIVYMNCTSPPSNVVDDYYTNTGSCVDNNTYAIVGDPQFGILQTQCRVKIVTLTSFWAPSDSYSLINNMIGNISYIDIHNALSYGFEISWMKASCPCDQCYLNDTIGEIQCLDQEIWYMELAFLLADYVAGIYQDYVAGIYQGLRELIGINKLSIPVSSFIYKMGIVTARCVLPYLAARIILIIMLFSVLLIYTYRRRHASIYENIEDFLQGNTLMPIRYSYKEIKQMTKNFKVKLGEGGFGDVYRGKLISGPFVAIKMLKIKSKANGQEFISEVATIGRIYHSNVGCDMQILHFDIKPHNILLDENFVPKVSDFGLAKLYPIDNSIVPLTAARGTIGYMAPELFYQNIGGVSYKADVYSFGMLLIEMTSRRKNLNSNGEHSSQLYFPFWIYDQLAKNREREIEDVIMVEINDVLKKMFLVALWCIQLKPIDRPSMNKVSSGDA